jgi:hypothetical protein
MIRSSRMFLTKINIDDLDKLQQFRLERLRHFFTSSLPFCLIRINDDNILVISCPHAGIMDELFIEMEDLRYYAGLILGVKSISLHLAQVEVLRTNTYLASLAELPEAHV